MKQFIFGLVLLCASCAWLNDGTLQNVGRALQNTGSVVQSVPIPIAQPIGLAISCLGLICSAIGKVQKKPELVRIGGIGALGGAGMAGTSLVTEEEAALVSPSSESGQGDHQFLVPIDPVPDEK